ncbi:MAG: hypothetical protein IT520_00005, partial [Burkholderiales bacterium]|nr:hypothetical protein [Burkholderiales bacterium]
QHQRWIDAIVGDAPPEATARDALAGMAIAEAIARSHGRGGQHVSVEAA